MDLRWKWNSDHCFRHISSYCGNRFSLTVRPLKRRSWIRTRAHTSEFFGIYPRNIIWNGPLTFRWTKNCQSRSVPSSGTYVSWMIMWYSKNVWFTNFEYKLIHLYRVYTSLLFEQCMAATFHMIKVQPAGSNWSVFDSCGLKLNAIAIGLVYASHLNGKLGILWCGPEPVENFNTQLFKALIYWKWVEISLACFL